MNKTGFYDEYIELLKFVDGLGVEEVNKRTGHAVKVLRGGHSFTIEMSSKKIPVCGVRKVFPKSAAAEVAWFALGTNKVDFINGYAPLWNKFVEDDGETIAAAYGYRWQSHFGRNQLRDAMATLANDPTDRQVVVCAWDPGSDALGAKAKKNVPCPVLFHLYTGPTIEGREVSMTVFMRSSDIFVGLPYDVMGHGLLLNAIVDQLLHYKDDVKWTMGTMTFNLSHAHLYDSHYSMVEECLCNVHEHIEEEPSMPEDWPLWKIRRMPNEYVAEVACIQKKMKQPRLHYRPEVIE